MSVRYIDQLARFPCRGGSKLFVEGGCVLNMPISLELRLGGGGGGGGGGF